MIPPTFFHQIQTACHSTNYYRNGNIEGRQIADPYGFKCFDPFDLTGEIYKSFHYTIEFSSKEYFPNLLILGLQYCMVDVYINETGRAAVLPGVGASSAGGAPRTGMILSDETSRNFL